MQVVSDPEFDEVREGQQAFRHLLNAMAWPGEVEMLPPTRVEPPPPWPASLVQVARSLLDAQVTFAVHGRGAEPLSRYLAVNAGARPAPLEKAEYVLAGPPLDSLDVWSLCSGTLLAPDRGATLLLACPFLVGDEGCRGAPGRNGREAVTMEDGEKGAALMALSGRGVRDQRHLVVDEDTARLMERLAARNDEYPLGIDLILVDGSGRMASLPRTTRWRREVQEWAM